MKELIRLAPLLKNYKGYTYFRECIWLAQKNEIALTAVIKEIYLPVAIKYHTSYFCVERDIRTLCKYVWANGGREAADLRGYLTSERAPANKKCIQLVLDILDTDDMSGLHGIFSYEE